MSVQPSFEPNKEQKVGSPFVVKKLMRESCRCLPEPLCERRGRSDRWEIEKGSGGWVGEEI